MLRISREDLFMNIASLMAQRGTCERGKVGVVFVKDGRIICTGYNGSPSGMPHCLDVGCEVNDIGCDRTLHAEAAAVSFAARKGISLEDTTVFSTHAPCYNCAKLLINAGVNIVYFDTLYRENKGINLLKEAGVKVMRKDSGRWIKW